MKKVSKIVFALMAVAAVLTGCAEDVDSLDPTGGNGLEGEIAPFEVTAPGWMEQGADRQTRSAVDDSLARQRKQRFKAVRARQEAVKQMFDGGSAMEPLKLAEMRQESCLPLEPVLHNAEADEGTTRAIPIDREATRFELGDAIGVYVCDANGTKVRENLKYVFTGNSWSGPAIKYRSDYHYFAYYPYRENGVTTGTTTSEETFFGTAASQWEVLDDQSTKEAFEQSDMLACKGYYDNENHLIRFDMKHMHGMLEIHFGSVLWIVDLNNKYNSYYFTDTVTQSIKAPIKFRPFIPYQRRIVHRTWGLQMEAVDSSWTYQTGHITPGYYQHLDIGHNGCTNVDYVAHFWTSLGDVMMSDGSLAHREDEEGLRRRYVYGEAVPVGIIVCNPGGWETKCGKGGVPWEARWEGAYEGPVDSLYDYAPNGDCLYSYERDRYSTIQSGADNCGYSDRTRCMVLALQDVTVSGSSFEFPDTCGAGYTWSEVLGHGGLGDCYSNYYNTHLWEFVKQKFPGSGLVQSVLAKTAPDDQPHADHWTPTSKWFVGTVKQYHAAALFGTGTADYGNQEVWLFRSGYFTLNPMNYWPEWGPNGQPTGGHSKSLHAPWPPAGAWYDSDVEWNLNNTVYTGNTFRVRFGGTAENPTHSETYTGHALRLEKLDAAMTQVLRDYPGLSLENCRFIGSPTITAANDWGYAQYGDNAFAIDPDEYTDDDNSSHYHRHPRYMDWATYEAIPADRRNYRFVKNWGQVVRLRCGDAAVQGATDALSRTFDPGHCMELKFQPISGISTVRPLLSF